MPSTGSYSLVAPCSVGRPYLDMAASVLVKAVMDLETYGHKSDCAIGDKAYSCQIRFDFGFGSPREELVAFYQSDWFRYLLDGFSEGTQAVYLDRVKALGGSGTVVDERDSGD